MTNLWTMNRFRQPGEVDPGNEALVRGGFWGKARATLGKVPFSEEAVAAFYCATDRATPLAIRTTLFAALAYFVMPFDAIPDVFLGLGFTDDAAVLVAAFTAARTYIGDGHRSRARAWLLKERAAAAA
ncbi:MAG: YkvA family protein [Reyranellaceae bacterium]